MENINSNKYSIRAVIPILFSFFVMGFVDIVSMSTSYAKADYGLSDSWANLLPMSVFLWFALFSIPAALIMRQVGRRNTVIISAIITTMAMLLPLVGSSFIILLFSFALLGIGNTILQVSLNPLMTNVVRREKVTSMLTLGQFIKAIASATGPLLIAFFSTYFYDWKLIFPFYGVLTVISALWLMSIKIDESSEEDSNDIKGVKVVLSLLKDRYILMLFTIIILIVGFEVGLLTTIPKYFIQSFGFGLDQGGYACSLFFVAKTLGTFSGSILLSKINVNRFFVISTFVSVISMLLFLITGTYVLLMLLVFIIGISTANIFAITFTNAIQYKPKFTDEISALMILGVSGGAIIPPLMGIIADISIQRVALLLPFMALIYILACALIIYKKH